MRKLKKLLSASLFLTLVMVFSAVVFSASAEDQSVQVTDVVYDTEATDSEAVSSISSVTLLWDGVNPEVIQVDEATQNATLTVDGIQYDIIGSYQKSCAYDFAEKDITGITLTTKGPAGTGTSKFDGARIPINYHTRAAAWIDSTGLKRDYSVTNAVVGGNTDSTASVNSSITSLGGFFNGYYIDGADYAISGLNMKLDGNGGDDFQGWGAGVTVTGETSKVSIAGSHIDTTGVIRTAIWVGGRGGSSLDVMDSVVVAHSDKDATPYASDDNYAVPMMEQVPFALGLEGNIRATNVLGNATARYSDSIVVSDGWGALSTDSGEAGTIALEVKNTLAGIGTLEVVKDGVEYTATKEVNGVKYGFQIEGSGYVTYADAGIIDNFENVAFYAPDYIGIIASRTSTMNFKESYGYAGRIGFMSHQSQGGLLNIEGGKFDVADTFITVKSGTPKNAYLNITVDGAEINIFGRNPQSGVLLQLMESDDTGGGPGAVSCPIQDNTLEEIKKMAPMGTIPPTTASFSDINVKGDIYNAVYRYTQPVDVVFTNSDIEGVISSSVAHHVDENGKQFNNASVYADGFGDKNAPENGYLYLGRIVNDPCETVNNAVNLTLKNSTWKVTGVSYLSSLVLEGRTSIVAPEDQMVIMMVNGEQTEIETGKNYAGVVVLDIHPFSQP